MKNALIGIAIVFLIAIGFWFGAKLDPKKLRDMFTITNTYYIKDSVTIVNNFHSEINNQKPIQFIERLDSTLTLDSSFVAEMDTTYNPLAKTDSVLGYKLNAKYFFPQNRFEYDLNVFYKKYYDTVKTEIQIPVPILNSPPWWDTPLKVGAGLLSGYTLSKIK